jgi:hypothetical protein
VLLGGEMSSDGVLTRAPMLVVRLGGPLSGETWLAAGARAVWACEDDAVWELTRGRQRALTRDEWLTHPDEAALRLPAAELRRTPAADARVGV